MLKRHEINTIKILVLGSIVVLSGCASTDNFTDAGAIERTICTNKSKTTYRNGQEVESEYERICDDSKVANPMQINGFSKNCGRFPTHMTLHNKDFYGSGRACFIEGSGTWIVF